MDQHRRRYYARSEQFTFLGRNYNLENTSLAQTRGNLRGEVQPHNHSRNFTMSDQYIFPGRNYNPGNTSLAQTRGNPRGEVQPHNHSRNFAPSDRYIFPGRSSHVEYTTRAQTRENLRGGVHSHYHSNPRSWSNVGINQHQHRNYAMSEQFSFLSGNLPTAVGRFPFKRKRGDVSLAFDIGNSSWSPFEASSSRSGLLDRQYNDNQHMSHLNTLYDSGRNVRSQSGPYLAPTPVRNHLNFSAQNFRITDVPVDHSVTTHYPDTNANTSAAWNFSFESSHGPGRTVSETNRVSSDANQFLSENGVEAGQYSYGAIAGRNAMPSLQYPEACRNRIPSSTRPTRHLGDEYEGRWRTDYQNDRATGAIERYTSRATMYRNDGTPLNGFHAGSGYGATSSDYSVQFPTEVYSSRYSRSSTGTGHTTYQSDRTWNINEHFPSPAAAMNRNDSMETQPRVIEDDYISYSPRPRERYPDDEYEAMTLDIDSMSYEDLLALGEHIGNVKTGLSSEKVSSCLVESLDCASEAIKEEKLCPICLDDLSNMDKAVKLRSCGHEYHVHCITKWLDVKNICPVCKRSVTSDS